jgi:hypothetical protein
MNIIQISDTHLGETPENSTRTQRLVAHIVDAYDPADTAVVHTGDVTHDGEAWQCREAARIFRPLVDAGFQFLPCPGNHDYRYSGVVPDDQAAERFHAWRRELAGAPKHWPYVTERGRARIICLDSCTNRNWHALARGEVGYAQRMRLAKYLEMGDELVNLVFLHHHAIHQHTGCEMLDAELLLAELAGRCKALAFGHNHKWGIWRETFGVNWIIASGKVTDLVEGALNYWLIRVDNDAEISVDRRVVMT